MNKEAPGQVLQQDYMKPLGITQEQLAKAIGVDRQRINAIVRGRRMISSDTAIRLACYFQTTPEYWLMLQLKQEVALLKNERTEGVYAKIVPCQARSKGIKIRLTKMATTCGV